MERLRYYVMYWYSPIPVMAAWMFGGAMAGSVALVVWWLLAMWTEETMRG